MLRSRLRVPVTTVAALVGLLVGCGDDGSSTPSPDAGISVDGSFVVAPPAPPDVPWLDLETFEESLPVAPPAIAPCPEGWREVSGECDPWPEGGPTACPFGQAHFPGEPGCRTVGTACPPGDFALGLPDNGTVVFARGGATGGDGTRAAPYGTITEALAVATSGQTVAVGKGIYDETVVLPEGVTLTGACAAETLLTPTIGTSYAVIYTEASDTAVFDLAIVDGSFPGIIATGRTAEIEVNGVILSGVSAVAMVAGAGATLAASRIAVTGTVPAADGNYGRALIAQEQAQVTVSHAVIADHADSSVTAVGEGTHLELRDVVVRDTRGAPAGNVGRGLGVDLGADVLLERVEIARANDMGIGVFRGTVTADYLVVRDTVGFEIATEITGPAVAVGNRARFDATRSVFHGNNTYTIWVDGGGEVTLEDAVVRDTLAYADGYYGYGIMVLEAGSFSATRIVLERNRTSALRAYGETAEAVLTDATIRDSLPADADGTYGRGVEVLEGALVTLRRARLERNRADGVFVVNGTVELEDVVVRDTMSQDRENDGRGVSCGTGCVATGRRVFLDANGAAGWFAGGESSTITDFVVRGTQGRALGNTVSGAGLDVRDGTTASASRVIALENHMLGVTASGAGTSLTLEDAVVRDTRLRDGQYGFGLVGFTGASLALSRVEVADNTAGLWVKGPDTTLSVTDAWFHDMRSAPVTMRGGEGIVLIDGVVATLTRVAVERTMRAGLLVHGGSEAMLDRFRARDVMREACGDACGGGFGIGLLAQVGSTVRATGFELSGAPLCGVYLADGSSVDLIDGEIAGNDIGACVRVSDYDVARLTQRVRYRDNRVNVETVDFSVPEPEVSLDGL